MKKHRMHKCVYTYEFILHNIICNTIYYCLHVTVFRDVSCDKKQTNFANFQDALIPIKELPQKFLEKDGEVQWGRILWGLGSSLPEKWMVERWTRPIYSGNMLVSGSEVLFFFCCVFFITRTSTKFGTGDEPLTACL